MKKLFLSKMVFCFLLIASIACASSATHPTKRDYENTQELFSVKGEVLWDGPSPVVYPAAGASYENVCGKWPVMHILRLSNTRLWHKRLLDVAVWLEPVWENMTPDEISNLRISYVKKPATQVTIEEKHCQFSPRMTIVPVGTVVDIVNRDRKDHWLVVEGWHQKRKQYIQVYGDHPNEFSLETPGVHYKPRRAPVELLTTKPDVIRLKSGFHRWMEGWVYVTDKIWYDLVSEKGFFEIPNVPRGVYRLHSWHPLLGENSSIIKVPEDTRHNVVAVSYDEINSQFERITSTVLSTSGEIREQHQVWEEIEEW